MFSQPTFVLGEQRLFFVGVSALGQFSCSPRATPAVLFLTAPLSLTLLLRDFRGEFSLFTPPREDALCSCTQEDR